MKLEQSAATNVNVTPEHAQTCEDGEYIEAPFTRRVINSFLAHQRSMCGVARDEKITPDVMKQKRAEMHFSDRAFNLLQLERAMAIVQALDSGNKKRAIDLLMDYGLDRGDKQKETREAQTGGIQRHDNAAVCLEAIEEIMRGRTELYKPQRSLLEQ